jgi:hypothetical protein
MAAGLGSRFGGVKQLARVGPADEAILDFSINDALAAGFELVVVIVRSEIERDVRDHLAEFHPGLSVSYVRQDDLGPPRDKPWGTLHAVLSAAHAIDGPFAVINADDYYGPESFVLAAGRLALSEPGVGANVAFRLGNTVPPRGAVTRALCEVSGHRLTGIVETDGCERLENGDLIAGGTVVPTDTPTSMNLWCFDPTTLELFREAWNTFFELHAHEPKAECQLPTVVGELVAGGRIAIEVVSSPERWIGITNPDDHELARSALSHR